MNNIASKTKNQIYKFLRKTQKYTETDNVYLAKGGFWLTLGQIISAIAGLLSIIAFANLLDPATYGNYKYILSLIGILGIFSLSGIKTAISQSVARGFEESFYSGLRIKFRYSLLGSATAVLLSIYYFIQGNNNLSVPLLASAIFLPLLQATQVFIPLLNGKKLFSNQIKYTSAIKIISTLSIIAALLVAKNIIWLISVFLISNTLLNSFFYLLVKNKFKPNKKTDPRTISYGKHASIAEGLNVAANYLDHLLIFNLLGPGALAVYSFSILLPNKLKNVFGTISLLALPKFAQRSKQEIKKSIFQKIAKLLSLILPITIIYIFCAPFIYKMFFPQYIESIPYSQFFAISLLGYGVLPITAIESKMAVKEKYILVLFANLSNIILILVLTIFFGIWGTIIGKITSQFLTFLFSLRVVKKF